MGGYYTYSGSGERKFVPAASGSGASPSSKAGPRVSGQRRHVTEIQVGHNVCVVRHSKYAGLSGRVSAARNGYLIVFLQNGKSAYFRSRNLEIIEDDAAAAILQEQKEAPPPEYSKKTEQKKRAEMSRGAPYGKPSVGGGGGGGGGGQKYSYGAGGRGGGSKRAAAAAAVAGMGRLAPMARPATAGRAWAAAASRRPVAAATTATVATSATATARCTRASHGATM